MVLLSRQCDFCDITTLVKRTRGQKTERQKDLKTFSKSYIDPLDTFVSVIYVTRVITVNLAVFVAVPTCKRLLGRLRPLTI